MTRRSLTLLIAGVVVLLSALAFVVSAVAFRMHGQALVDMAAKFTIATFLLTIPVTLVAFFQLYDRFGPPTDDEIARQLGRLATIVHGEASAALARLLGDDPRPERTGPPDGGGTVIDLTFDLDPVHYNHAGGAATGKLADVYDYFVGLSPRRLLILGESGSGKSLLTLQLLLRMLEQEDPGRLPLSPGRPPRVPVLFSLSTLEDAGTAQAWLRQELTRTVSRRVATALVDRGLVLPICDGLDELDPDGEAPVNAERVIRLLNAYRVGRGPGPVVVSSRTDLIGELGVPLHTSTAIRVRRLDGAQVGSYFTTRTQTPEQELGWHDVGQLLLGTGSASEGLREVLSTPWIASLSWLVCQETLTPAELFFHGPDAVADPVVRPAHEIQETLLANFVNASLARYRSGGGRVPTDAHAHQVLATIAAAVRATGAHSTGIVEINLEQWWHVADRFRSSDRTLPGGRARRTPVAVPSLRRLHGLLGTAVAMVAVLAVLLSLPGGGSLAKAIFHSYLPHPGTLKPVFALALGVSALGLLAVPPLSYVHASGERVRATRLTGNVGRTFRWVVLFTIIGAACGLGAGAVFGHSGGLATAARVYMSLSAGLGASTGVAIGLSVSARGTASYAPHPSSVMRDDAVAALTVGVPVALVTGSAGLAAAGPWFGVGVGFAFGLVALAVPGPRAFLRYYLAVAVTAARLGLPLRLARLLDLLVDAGVLRVIGTSYQFRHAEFLHWLERPPSATVAGTLEQA